MADELRLKVLDCDRKAILGLPSPAVHLFFVYWMHENEAQESYLSRTAIERITGWSRNTVIKWRTYLIDNGWLMMGATAAERYSHPTNGAWKVPVVRVDDPIAGGGSSKNEPLDGVVQQMNHPNFEPKVYGSGSSSGSSSSSDSIPYASAGEVASLSSLPSGEEKHENQKPTAKPILPVPSPNPVTPPPASATRKKVKTAKDGTRWPDDFNSWTNLDRTNWLHDHAPDESKQEPPQLSPVKTQSPEAAASPAPQVATATTVYHTDFDPACSLCLEARQPCAWEDFDD